MQKRLLALVATVAMVLSMFAGIAFAADPEPGIALSTTKVTSSYPHLEYQFVSGAITGFDAEETYYVVVEGVYEDEDAIEVKNGSFNFYLPTNLEPQDVAVSVYDSDDVFFVKEDIKVRYNVVTTPDKLEFPFTNEQKPEAITGKVTNSKGEGVEGVIVKLGSYFGDGGVTTNSKGEFGYVVLKWKASGALSLTVEGPLVEVEGEDPAPSFAAKEHKTGKVIPKAATLSVKPSTGVVHTIADVKFTVTGAGFGTGDGTADFTLKKGDDSFEVENEVGAAKTTFVVEDGEIDDVFVWNPPAAGTYTLTVTKDHHSASATITVTNPVSYNLINGSKLEELKVGSNEFAFNISDIHLVQYKADGNIKDDFFYTITVDGKTVEDTITEEDFVKLSVGAIDISAAKLGTKAIKVMAYTSDAADAKAVFEKTITAKVVGWDIAVDPTELTVNQAQNVVVVIKDEDGAPINNARITLDNDYKQIEPGSANVQNGTYTFKDVKFATPGTKWLKIYKGTASPANLMAELKIEVVGQKVYNVTADVDALLQGKGEDVKFTVTRDGVAVMTQRIKWVYEDGTSGEAYPTYVGDGVSKATIKATKAGELTVRAENFDGTLCGETTINVVAPQLVLIDEETANVTENFETTVNFKVVDPRDGSAIKSNLAINGLHTAIEVYDANGGIIVPDVDEVAHVLGEEEYTLTFLATAADYEEAEEEEEVVAVQVKVNGALLDAHFEVKEATLTSDPGMIVINAQNNLTLTYEDANGNPIAGKKVIANEADLGKTDENGQVVYPAGIVAAAVKAEAETDTDAKVSLTIKIGYDTEAPKVTWELDGNKATIVITDNVRLVRINIDGKEIDFWPGAKYEFVRTLQPGVNKFNIKAQDSNDNVFDEVVEIEYLTDAIVLDGANVSRQGEYLFVQARQFADFGAEFGWNQATKTATFVLDDVKVEVTIGSTTAKVNGETVTMPVAPFLANDRTYVPVRFISENLGWNVHWAAGDVVTITLP